MKLIKLWLIPLTIALVLFSIVRPVFAQVVQGNIGLSEYLLTNSLKVGTDSIEGYTQVYYEYNGSRKYITLGNISKRMPVSNGEYIAFVSDIDGMGQVFLYNVLTESIVQLTFSGMNLNPKIDSKGRVVWEGWTSGDTTWQIYFFDGKSIEKLTNGDLSLNPEISGEFIVYGRRNVSGTWTATLYSISDKKTIDISVGENARNPKIKDGKIYLTSETGTEEQFPLTAPDLLLLDFSSLSATASATSSATPAPQPTPETVTVEQIAEELKATTSASPTESAAPESSSSGQLEVQ